MTAQSADPGLWRDPAAARATLRRLARLGADAEASAEAAAHLAALRALCDETEAAADAALLADIAAEAAPLAARVRELWRRACLDGPDDERGAVIVIEPAGLSAGCDWAADLARMYLRWAERRGGEAHVVLRQEGDDGHVRRVILQLPQRFAFGLLAGESGAHALDAADALDPAGRRRRARAWVAVLPEAEEGELHGVEGEVTLLNVRLGHGVSCHGPRWSVLIQHPPTGVAIPCEEGHEPRVRALAVIRAHVLAGLSRAALDRARSRGGSPLRTYAIGAGTPEVHDHRTGVIASTYAVLDGDLDDLLDARLEHRMGRDPRAGA